MTDRETERAKMIRSRTQTAKVRREALAEGRINGGATRALVSSVGQNISNLLLLSANQLNAKSHLSKFGLNSVLAAELRYHLPCL